MKHGEQSFSTQHRTKIQKWRKKDRESIPLLANLNNLLPHRQHRDQATRVSSSPDYSLSRIHSALLPFLTRVQCTPHCTTHVRIHTNTAATGHPCTYCATFSKRVRSRAKNPKYPMLTRDTCRSVDFTAWRVCPHTHTHTHIYVFEGISSSYTCSIREQHEERMEGGAVGKRSWRGVLHACVHVVGAT